ncbi:DUF4129 domain-containing protein [Trichlorobacter lovleyi]|uniref:DUF4129 domain-containing protein n=1 Tax=Trichlorobacter lovleyi TaxID=313985 RepID=UPI002240918F|nr:DUF4129 domain-containing protein [Trichlorobacter lovleyi]QOX80537.1 DUF4129 domain-containing protein [Trichlorobacter lovleyi]
MIRIPKSREKGIGAVELLEQATALLRQAPLDTLACYYLGSLPFMLVLLWFWADMSRNADADQRLAGGALVLSILFVWMKVWQSRFSGRLLQQLGGAAELPALSGSVMVQGGLQPWGFIILPMAGLITLPFGWCYAFFQNITVLGGPDWRTVQRKARRLALLWPGQNHLLLALLALIFLVLFANIAVGVYFLPHLLKTLFGIETIFTRSDQMLLNSTFWAAIAVLTQLCLDPLVKACYVLRCHYGESLSSGADLRAQIKSIAGRAALLVPLIAFWLVTCGSLPVSAAPQTDEPQQRLQQRAARLDRAAAEVIKDPRFAWRLPREHHQLEKRALPGFMQSIITWIQDSAATVGGWIDDVIKWLLKKLPKPSLHGGKPGWGGNFSDVALLLLYLLLALLLCFGAIFAWRRLRRTTQPEAELPMHTLQVAPDLHDESLIASELTEERWLALARELLEKGELRLGLRALYLATLAALADAKLVVIARCKTNHDYERELLRFSHALPRISEAFSLNLRIFEAAWYGMHLPDDETVRSYLDNHRRITSDVRTQ